MYSEFKLTQVDNTVLFCRKWIPTAEAKALFILVHGKGEHSGRYDVKAFWQTEFKPADKNTATSKSIPIVPGFLNCFT